MKSLKLTLLLGLLALPAAAQTPSVSISPNTPLYGLTALHGEVLCPNFNVSGGATNRVNWTIPSGGAVFRATNGANFPGPSATTIANGTSFQCVEITASPGSLSFVGTPASGSTPTSAGAYITSSTIVTLHGQAVDDPTQSADLQISIAANTTTVRMMQSHYQQVYKNQYADLNGVVLGNTDQSGTWSLVSSPAGSAPTLVDAATCNSPGVTLSTGCRTLYFLSTTAGRYVLQYTSHADPTKFDQAIIYVASQALPVFTNQHTMPVPCEVDPAFTGAVYEIGPGQPYADLVSTPAANTIAPGSIFRLHYATYHNYYQVAANGTMAQPIVYCGVPDAGGNLPILDGDNSTGQAGVVTLACFAEGLFCLHAGGYGRGTPSARFQDPLTGPTNITIAGLHLRNTRQTSSTWSPGAAAGACPTGTGTCAWDPASSGVHIAMGQFVDVLGVWIENSGNGFATYGNAGNNRWGISQSVRIAGSYIVQWGNPGSATEHAIYFQTFFGIIESTEIGEPQPGTNPDGTPTVGASCMKWRGIQGIMRYNVCPVSTARDYDGVGVQDASEYIDLAVYTDHGFQAANDGTLNDVAGLQAVFYGGDWFYGNQIRKASGELLHYLEDHDLLMAMRQGQLYAYSNSVSQTLAIFGVSNNQNPSSHYLSPVDHAFNNLFGGGAAGMANFAYAVTNSQTNVFSNNRPDLPFSPIAVSSWYIIDNGDGTHELIVNAPNNFAGAGLTQVALAGFSGSAGACLNSTFGASSPMPVRYGPGAGGGGNFQGITTCALSASSGSPNTETTATVTQEMQAGWYTRVCNGACPYSGVLPLEGHNAGLSPANFIVDTAPLFDTTTFRPGTAHTGSPLVAGAQLFPVRFEYDLATHALLPRTQPLVIGARDPASGGSLPAPTLSSIAVTPSPVSLVAGATRQLTATCTYSDASTVNCTSSAAWSNGGASAFTISSSGLVTGVAAGSGTATAALNGVSGSAPVTVTAAAQTVIRINGRVNGRVN